MEEIKGKGITFYLDKKHIYFKTPIQTMRVQYTNPRTSKMAKMYTIRAKIRSGKIDTISALYMQMDDKINCISSRLR